MITFFVIGIFVLTVTLIQLAFKAAWGIMKIVFFVIGVPGLLIVLFVSGLVYAALPLLVLALLVAFLRQVFKRI